MPVCPGFLPEPGELVKERKIMSGGCFFPEVLKTGNSAHNRWGFIRILLPLRACPVAVPPASLSASFDDHSFGLFNLTPWDVFAVLQVFQD